jgi:hypothetical protein
VLYAVPRCRLLGEGDDDDIDVPSDGDDDIDMAADSDMDDEMQEAAQVTSSKEPNTKKVGGAPKRSRSMFASADNYMEMLDELYNKARASSNDVAQKEDGSKSHPQRRKAGGRPIGRDGSRR